MCPWVHFARFRMAPHRRHAVCICRRAGCSKSGPAAFYRRQCWGHSTCASQCTCHGWRTLDGCLNAWWPPAGRDLRSCG